MSSTYSEYKAWIKSLDREIERLVRTDFFRLHNRNDVREAVQRLLDVESRLAIDDPFRLPNKEAESVKRRAAVVLKATEGAKLNGESVDLSIRVPSRVAGELRILANTIGHRTSDRGDVVTVEEAIEILLELYVKDWLRVDDCVIRRKDIYELAKSRYDQPPHSLTQEQKEQIDNLFASGLPWRLAMDRVLKPKKARKPRQAKKAESI